MGLASISGTVLGLTTLVVHSGDWRTQSSEAVWGLANISGTATQTVGFLPVSIVVCFASILCFNAMGCSSVRAFDMLLVFWGRAYLDCLNNPLLYKGNTTY